MAITWPVHQMVLRPTSAHHRQTDCLLTDTMNRTTFRRSAACLTLAAVFGLAGCENMSEREKARLRAPASAQWPVP